ncbi:MAG: hypothetical protein H7144_15805 [Burkholderiales bacterium]|nr:hypothetical protein [Phycisphaerae bacterium]
MDIEEMLKSITSKSLAEIKREFLDLFGQAKKDGVEFIKYSATQIQKALGYLAEGKLDTDDVSTLLKKLKKMAQIEANNATIAVLTRIQKIVYRIIDIALDVLVKAIVPIA